MARGLVVACAAVSLVVFGATTTAAAQGDEGARLASARELVVRASYRQALSELESVLDDTALSARERNEALELRAVVHLAMRQDALASATLAELYGRDPGHRLTDPEASPRVQSAFARAREGAQAQPVLLRQMVNDSGELQVHVEQGADAVHEIRLFSRPAAGASWSTSVLTLDSGRATGHLLTGQSAASSTIEYYLELVAPSGALLAMAGSRETPETAHVVPVTAAQPDSGSGEQGGAWNPVNEVWFWVAVGVATVLLGVGIGVGTSEATKGPQDGTLGNVTLPLVELRF